MKHTLYALLASLIVVFMGSFVQADLMDTIFQPSKNLEQVINIGNSSRSVGNSVFRGGITIGLGGFGEDAPLLVTIAQVLLRLVVILSVPVLIFVGIKIIYGATQGKSLSEGMKGVSNVLLGLVIALSAVGIIYLIQSLAARSLIGL